MTENKFRDPYGEATYRRDSAGETAEGHTADGETSHGDVPDRDDTPCQSTRLMGCEVRGPAQLTEGAP
jgi:hypothetical protein